MLLMMQCITSVSLWSQGPVIHYKIHSCKMDLGKPYFSFHVLLLWTFDEIHTFSQSFDKFVMRFFFLFTKSVLVTWSFGKISPFLFFCTQPINEIHFVYLSFWLNMYFFPRSFAEIYTILWLNFAFFSADLHQNYFFSAILRENFHVFSLYFYWCM